MPTVYHPRRSYPAFGDGVLRPFDDSIWTAASPIRFAGTWFPHVMAVIRLRSGEVLLHSPCRPSETLVSAIGRIGSVAHVVAPNWFHDLYLSEYRELYPNATFWAPAFLQRRRRSLIERALDGATIPPWSDEMPHIALTGLLSLDECIFLHAPTRTLLVADVLMNASANAGAPLVTRLGYRLFGLDGTLKTFPVMRWFGYSSRASLRLAAAQITRWNPQRLIVGHGTPLKENVDVQLRAALDWLNT